MDRQSPADFGALKPLCMIRHGGHTSLYICPDPQNGREPRVKHGLWMATVSQRRFTDCGV